MKARLPRREARLKDARLIAVAARRFRRYVEGECRSRLTGPERWLEICRIHGLCVGPLENCPASYTARLWYSEEHDLWVIGYNRRARRQQIARYLCHEFSEWLAVTDHMGLFDGLPGVRPEPSASGTTYCYTGGADPGAVHHRIARRVEELCFRGFE